MQRGEFGLLLLSFSIQTGELACGTLRQFNAGGSGTTKGSGSRAPGNAKD
jgi:hypothetical protein